MFVRICTLVSFQRPLAEIDRGSYYVCVLMLSRLGWGLFSCLRDREVFFVKTGLLILILLWSMNRFLQVLTGWIQPSQFLWLEASSFCAACLSLLLSFFLMGVCKLLTPSELQLKLESDANPQGSTTASPLHTYTCKQTCKEKYRTLIGFKIFKEHKNIQIQRSVRRQHALRPDWQASKCSFRKTGARM